LKEMKAEEYRERKLEVGGWPVNLTSYRLDKEFHCKADNVSPGAALARTTGATRVKRRKRKRSRERKNC
jgi:hypothetical protein